MRQTNFSYQLNNFLKYGFYSIFIIIIFSNVCLAKKTSIFILASYNKNDSLSEPEYQGVLYALKNSRLSSYISIYSYFLDSRRVNPKNLQKNINKAIQLIKKINPKIIITLDDLAFEIIMKHFYKWFEHKRKFLVFCGINTPIKIYNKKYNFLKNNKIPIKNITGIYEAINIDKQIQLLKLIFKEPFYIAILHSIDYMGNIIKAQVINELSNTKLKNKIKFFPVKNLKDLKKSIQIINKSPLIKAYIPAILKIKTSNNKYLSVAKISPILLNNIKKLDLAVNFAFVNLGFWGGVCTDIFRMGYQAGDMVLYLIQRYPIKKLPVEYACCYKIIINKRRTKQLNLKLPDIFWGVVDEIR
ncbi:MAG: ABC transporter substrate binding protein [Desulfonauticus sp.]|nr:ABC transporter substrate binding protein [Desulfonauticus sp.]